MYKKERALVKRGRKTPIVRPKLWNMGRALRK